MVNTGEWFVEKEKVGTTNESASDKDALGLTTREYLDVVVRPIGEVHCLQGFHGGTLSLAAAIRPEATRAEQAGPHHFESGGGDAGRRADTLRNIPDAVPFDGARLVEVLSKELHGTGGGRNNAQAGPYEGRFAGTIGSQQGHSLTRGDAHTDVVQNLRGAKCDIEVRDL